MTPNTEALTFLMTRRSRPAKTLTGPYPDRATLEPLLTAAARTPDHGKLEPWRFVVLQGAALKRLEALTAKLGTDRGLEPEKVAKAASSFGNAGCVVAVVASPKPSEKVPLIEQTLSAGAVCLSLLNACLAAGWGGNWLTGWMAFDDDFLGQGLGIQSPEFVAGFIHIGTETSAPPDRPRPDLDAITAWVTK